MDRFSLCLMVFIFYNKVNQHFTREKPMNQSNTLSAKLLSKSVRLEIVIDESMAWALMDAFDQTFPIHEVHNPSRTFYPVREFVSESKNWHVFFTLKEEDEKRFWDFFKQFCLRHNIEFQE